MPTAQQELERLTGKFGDVKRETIPQVVDPTAESELSRLTGKFGMGGPSPFAPTAAPLAGERFEPEPAAALATGVAEPELPQQTISERPGTLTQRVGDWIAEKGRSNAELAEKANQIVTDFTASVPKEDIRSLSIRGASGVGTGLAGFFGGQIPEMVGRVLGAEPGTRLEAGEEVTEEFIKGARDLAGSALVVGDHLIRKYADATPDPFDETAYDYFMNSYLGKGAKKITELILGEPLTKEKYDQIIEQAIERPEEPVFGALILAGTLKTGAKITGKAARRLGPPVKKALTKKRGLEKPEVTERVPVTEQAMRTELTERAETAKEVDAKFFGEKEIAGMTRAELKYYIGRTDLAPREVIEGAKEITRDRRGRDRAGDEVREEGRVREGEKVKRPDEPVGRGERPIEKGKTPEAVAKELGVKFKGLQERPRKDAAGKVIKPVEIVHEYQFTDPVTGSDFTVKKLSDAAADLKTTREGFEKAKPAEVPVKPKEKPPVAEVPKKEVPPKPPVEPEPIGLEKAKTVGLNKAENEWIRKNTGLNELPEAERQSRLEVYDTAKREGLVDKALSIANEVRKSGRPITTHEHAALNLKVAERLNAYDEAVKQQVDLINKGDTRAAQLEANRKAAIQEEIATLTDAARHGRREAARTMGIGREAVDRSDYSLATAVQQATAVKGKRLTPRETAKVEDATKKYLDLKKEMETLQANFDETVARRDKEIAARVAAGERKKVFSRTEKGKKQEQDKREIYKKELQALGFQVKEVTGVGAEAAYIIGKIATSYLREGALSLEQVVSRIRNDIPALSDQDVYRALTSKDPHLQRKAATEATKHLRRIKTQARLLLEIEKAEKGIFDPAKKRPPASDEIRALQTTLRQLRNQAYETVTRGDRLERVIKTINELQDQLENQYRAIRKARPPSPVELAAAKEKIKDLRREMRVEDILADLNEQIRTGEYKIPEKVAPKALSPAMEKKQVELELARRKVGGIIRDMQPWTKGRVGVETINTLRTMKATADLSATFRQGFMLAMTRPQAVPKAFAQSLQATFSKFKAEQIDAGMRNAPHHYIRVKSKLFLAELDGRLNAREEMFMANAIEKVPVIGEIVKASNRHMTTFLNLMRTSVFDGFLEAYPNATRFELTTFADVVNVFSGRGNLGRASAIANELSLVVFAPRFAASRIQTPYMIFKHWKHPNPRVRKEVAKAYMRTAVVGGSILGLAELAGYDVGIDPRSPDWGKIRIGDTSVDIWAGVQQPMRLVIRIGYAASDRVGLSGIHLTDREKNLDPVDLIGRFAAFKLGPGITIPRELLTGKTAVGEPVTPLQTAVRAVIPFVLEDIYDAYRLEGKKRAGLTAGLTGLGIGVSTYERFRTVISAKRRIKRLIKLASDADDPDYLEEAREIKKSWNERHPKEKIFYYIPKGVR